MRKILIILGLLTNLSCVNDTKTPSSISISDNNQQNVYNDILNELVEKHFYNLYLGADFEKIEEKFDFNRDNPEYLNEVEKLRTVVRSDTSRQSAICLSYELLHVKFSQLSIENFKDSTDNPADLRNIFRQFSNNYNAVYDSLTTAQQLSTNLFRPSSFKVKKEQCYIGVISFSKAFINTQGDKGLLYYEFVCDEKCGKGELLWIEKKEGKWTIQKKGRMWIM